ncbi:MAG TPA: biotin/lipoyl-containing protein [Mobilitalea sp.]|nr:biotin/lipoyl-containing protein [Mobilitalea sp.]
MKYYTITVNGNTYQVSVEEGLSAPVAYVPAPAPVAAPVAAAPVAAAPVAAPAPQAPAPAPTASAGGVKISSPMPGKIISAKVSVGQSVKKGEVVLILEAMKMENEIVAPQDGTVASINVNAGQTIEAGDLLATLN